MTVPKAPNDRRSLDFVSDQLTDGRRFRLECLVGGRHFALRHPGGGGNWTGW